MAEPTISIPLLMSIRSHMIKEITSSNRSALPRVIRGLNKSVKLLCKSTIAEHGGQVLPVPIDSPDDSNQQSITTGSRISHNPAHKLPPGPPATQAAVTPHRPICTTWIRSLHLILRCVALRRCSPFETLMTCLLTTELLWIVHDITPWGNQAKPLLKELDLFHVIMFTNHFSDWNDSSKSTVLTLGHGVSSEAPESAFNHLGISSYASLREMATPELFTRLNSFFLNSTRVSSLADALRDTRTRGMPKKPKPPEIYICSLNTRNPWILLLLPAGAG